MRPLWYPDRKERFKTAFTKAAEYLVAIAIGAVFGVLLAWRG